MGFYGVDASIWQGTNVDFNKLKADGNKFAIFRAGYGDALSYPKQFDTTFNSNCEKAHNAGLDVGAYWYCYATDEKSAKREAESCLQAIRGKKFEFPIFYDIEELSTLNLPVVTCDKILKTFCDTLLNNGYYAGLYCSTWWAQKSFSIDMRDSVPLWIAEYGTSKCNYPRQFAIWQYGTVKCDTASGGVIDSNIAYENLAQYIITNGLNGYAKQDPTKTKILQKIAAIKADLNELERMI